MQKTIKDIRKKLLENLYLNEEHVKFSIVSRLLTYLGWNIWNPTEVFYDYPIQRLSLSLNDSPSYGKVSLALFVSQDINKNPEVYIQTTSKGKLLTNITTYEDQLNLYSSYDMAVISILTDGDIWRFYRTSAAGISKQKLFTELNIIEDSDDFIINILNSILAKNKFPQDAITTKQRMLLEKNKIQNINSVKEEAEKAAKRSHLDKYQIAKSILEIKSLKYDIEEIKQFWNYRPTALHKHIVSKTKESKPPIDKQTINCDNSFEDVDNLDLSGKSPKKFLSSTSGMM